MKKSILAVTLMALVLGVTACSSKSAEPETTAATEAPTTAPETTEEETEEEIEEDSFSGVITAVDGDLLMIKSDGDDSEKEYDVSNAVVTKQFDFEEGDQVYVVFPAETTEDPVPVIELEVEVSVIGESMDPSVEGIVKDAANSTLTLEVDGEEYTMASGNAYVVAQNGITVDKNATVTYIGDLDDEPIAVKIVMEDSYNTPDADINAFIGEVAQVEEDNIVLMADNGDFYTFFADGIDFTEYSVGQTVQVTYVGRVSGKDITATSIEAK